MPKHVRDVNGQVIECLDSLPERPGDWREAIEVAPTLVQFRQIYGSHHFDTTKNPVEIVWSVIDLNEQERKETLMNMRTGQLQMQIQQEMQKEFAPNEEQTNLAVVGALMEQLRAIKAEIAALTTHKDIDAYIAAKGITL